MPRGTPKGTIDRRRRVQRIDRVLEIDAKCLVRIQRPSDGDQALREIGIHAPVAHGIGVGEGVARHGGAHAEVVELGALRAQARFDIAKAFAVGQLREGHAQELVEARKRFDLPLFSIPRHDPTKGVQRQMVHDLRENQLACVHDRLPWMVSLHGCKSVAGRSSR